MSCELAINVQNLSKCYHIYDRPRDRLLQMLMRGRRQYFREFWALRNVSFSVRKGECVGIVGQNGSGKSTLLQLISGTLNPSGGSILNDGRVAALLELGSGFNPEFTGRENVYMNAAVLGLSAQEINGRYEEIVRFADIGEFIDQPVRTYSSGMMVRLAFAVAINVDPQILIVDEALSVGDERFQRKCFSRIEELRNRGVTILFVSHSGGTVVELCDRAILLDGGELIACGAPKQIIGKYQKLMFAPVNTRHEIRDEIVKAFNSADMNGASFVDPALRPADAEIIGGDMPQLVIEQYHPALQPTSTIAYASHGATIDAPAIVNLQGDRVNCLVRGRRYWYRYRVHFSREAKNVRFGMMIKTISGSELGGAVSAPSLSKAIPKVDAGSFVDVEFSFSAALNSGSYFLNAGVLGVTDKEETYLHRVLDACMFKVLPVEQDTATGLVDFSAVADAVITNAVANVGV